MHMFALMSRDKHYSKEVRTIARVNVIKTCSLRVFRRIVHCILIGRSLFHSLSCAPGMSLMRRAGAGILTAGLELIG
jgi:hypothetical protein